MKDALERQHHPSVRAIAHESHADAGRVHAIATWPASFHQPLER